MRNIALMLCVKGVMVGSIYALISLGFNVIYRTTGVLNFAQGEFVMIGGMAAAWLYGGGSVPLWGALAAGLLGAGLAGLLVEGLAADAANGTAMPATKLMAGEQLSPSDPQRPVVLDFIKEYDRHGLKNLSTHSGYAWDAVQLVFKAMEKAGTEPAALRPAIENTRDYVGVSGIYNLCAQDHCGLGVDSMVIVRVENGGWKLVE